MKLNYPFTIHTIRFESARVIRVLLAASFIGLGLLACTFPVLAGPGDLDQTFGIGGRIVSVLPGHNLPNNVAIRADGKIVVQGYTYGDIESSFLAQYLVDGTLDTSFGSNGTVIFPNSAPHFEYFPNGLAISPDGKILISGRRYEPAKNLTLFAVLRLNPDGSRDASFGDYGLVIVSFGTGINRWDSGERLLVQPDGSIAIAGYAQKDCYENPWEGYICSFEGLGIVRLRPGGDIDTSFGTSGKMIIPTTTANSFGSINDFRISPNGKLLLIGQNVVQRSDFRIFLSRVNSDGTIDTSFGTNGILVPGINEQVDISRMAIQPDGKIVFPVSNNRHSPIYSSVVRLNADGTVDASFGTDGRILIPKTESLHIGEVLINRDGKILIGGFALTNGAIPFHFAVTRLNTDGSRDATFGENGLVKSLLASYGGGVSSMALQPDGKLVAVGGVSNGDPDENIGMVRYVTENVPTFVVSGRVTAPDGRGLRNATVFLTDTQGIRRQAITSSLGHYSFTDVESGKSYVAGVSSRRYRFVRRNLDVLANVAAVDFTGFE